MRAMAMSIPVRLPLSSSKCHGGLVLPVPTMSLPRSSVVRSTLSDAACAAAFCGSSTPPAARTAPAAAPRPSTLRRCMKLSIFPPPDGPADWRAASLYCARSRSPVTGLGLRQPLGLERALGRWALSHSIAMVEHARGGAGIDAVALRPARNGEEIGVGDRVALAHGPRTSEHLSLDQIEAGADGLRRLLLHRLVRRRVVRPTVAASAMRVRHMHGRAEIAHEGLQLGERERIVERRELSLRMRLRDIGENGGRFRQHAAPSYEGRPPAFRIYLEIGRLRLLGGAEVDPSRFVSGVRLFERNMRSKSAAVGGVIEREHGGPRMMGLDGARPYKVTIWPRRSSSLTTRSAKASGESSAELRISSGASGAS